ncbi:MAG TPA: hypothetical protein DHU81_16420 [Hyphomonas sp.]|nr:hypothetical protein [Hyphomonas sp.]
MANPDRPNAEKISNGLRKIGIWVPAIHAEEYETYARNLVADYLAEKADATNKLQQDRTNIKQSEKPI